MLITLQDAREHVANFVTTGGACPNRGIVDDRINQAIRRLLPKADWDKTTTLFKVQTQNGCITLPRECETARVVNICGAPRELFHKAYEFMEAGPGEFVSGWAGVDLKDMGDGFPTFFDIPTFDPDCLETPEGPYKIFAVSPSAQDLGKLVIVQGPTDLWHEVRTNGVPGEPLPIAVWDQGQEGVLCDLPTPLTTNTFKSITGIQLPAGRVDYVSLYAVDPATNKMYFLSKYHPDETFPGYHRYKILGKCCEDDICVTLRCKLRYIPASRADDVLLIQNLDALKFMVIAIREENARNLQEALAYEQKAVFVLDEDLRNQEDGHTHGLDVSRVFHFGRGVGRIM